MVVKSRARRHRPLCLCCAEGGRMPFSLRRAVGDADDSWAADDEEDDYAAVEVSAECVSQCLAPRPSRMLTQRHAAGASSHGAAGPRRRRRAATTAARRARRTGGTPYRRQLGLAAAAPSAHRCVHRGCRRGRDSSAAEACPDMMRVVECSVHARPAASPAAPTKLYCPTARVRENTLLGARAAYKRA
jgi:hypothetical protein